MVDADFWGLQQVNYTTAWVLDNWVSPQMESGMY